MKLSIAIIVLFCGVALAARAQHGSKTQQGGSKTQTGGKQQQGGSRSGPARREDVTTPAIPAQQPGQLGIPANQFCFDCLMRESNRDLFSNPLDCHTYYQCQLLNETEAIGLVRLCPPGTFFDESRLVCREEGPVPCQPSPCDNPTVASLGCYQLPGQSCRQYFTCGQTEARCCPMNTRFNPSTCGCDDDATCMDYCQTLPTATQAPTFNDTACSDAFGNTLLPVMGRPDLFQLGDYTLACATGSLFDMMTCECSTAINLTESQMMGMSSGRQCKLWLPFDQDLQDQSISHFTVFAYGDAMLDVSTAASGTGSLRVTEGHLEIPGMKSLELNEAEGVSWCFAFRCGSNGGSCSTNGGILSNDKDASASVFSFIGAIFGADTLVGRVQTDSGDVNVNSPISGGSNGWNSACVVYRDNSTVEMWVNGALRGSAALTGALTVAHCPYAVGHDQFYGFFNGNIDNVLVCNTALTESEISSFSSGDIASLEDAGLIPLAGAVAPVTNAPITNGPVTNGQVTNGQVTNEPVTSPTEETTVLPQAARGARQQGGRQQGNQQTKGSRTAGGKAPREQRGEQTGRAQP